MINKIKRLRALFRLWCHLPDELNRRVEVENRLLMAASGQKPLPDADECRRLAYKLGVTND